MRDDVRIVEVGRFGCTVRVGATIYEDVVIPYPKLKQGQRFVATVIKGSHGRVRFERWRQASPNNIEHCNVNPSSTTSDQSHSDHRTIRHESAFDDGHALMFHFRKDDAHADAILSSVIVWKNRPSAVKPMVERTRLRDLRPDDRITVFGKPATLVEVEVYR